MNDGPVDDRLKRALEAREYLADLFLVLHLDESSSGFAPDGAGPSPVLRVPASLHALLAAVPESSDDVLELMLLWAREDTRGMSGTDLGALARSIRKRYAELREARLCRPIADEADPAIDEAIARLISAQPDARGAFSRMLETVRTSTVTLLSVSLRSGMSILMRGRDLCRLLRDRIAQLELPSKVDDLADRKAALFRSLYAFKGIKGTKVFVGLALSVTGIWVAAPALTGAGVVLAIVDP